MEPTQQSAAAQQPLPPPLKKSSKKLIIILVITILLVLFTGAFYYYFESYQPSQYAKAVIPLYDKIRSQEVIRSNKDGSNDYEDILVSLDQYYVFLSQINNELSKIKPSPINTAPSILVNTRRSQQIQEDFTEILKVFTSTATEAKKRAEFMIKAKELFLLLRPDLTEYPPKAVPEGQGEPLPPPPSTVGEYLSVWEERVSKAKIVAQDLFSQPQDLGNISFAELKSLWFDTEQGFDALIPFLKNQDPKLPLSDAQKLVPESQKTVFDKVDQIDKFLPMLESVLIRNSTENILKSALTADSVQSELKLRGGRLDLAIKHIREKYSK